MKHPLVCLYISQSSNVKSDSLEHYISHSNAANANACIDVETILSTRCGGWILYCCFVSQIL